MSNLLDLKPETKLEAALQKELAKVTDKLKEVCTFYSDHSNWSCTPPDRKHYDVMDKIDLVLLPDGDYVAGKLAYETLMEMSDE